MGNGERGTWATPRGPRSALSTRLGYFVRPPGASPGDRMEIVVPILIVYCTCPDAASAQSIARALVEERLAACVNCVPGVVSTYRWQGRVQVDNEVQLAIKTVRERYPALQARLLELHPYELPQIVAVDSSAGLDPYLSWVAEATRT